MAFRITVLELAVNPPAGSETGSVERYAQTVDILELAKLVALVNAKPRKPRERKAKDVK